MTEVRGNIYYGHKMGFFPQRRKLEDSEKQRFKKSKNDFGAGRKRKKMVVIFSHSNSFQNHTPP